jgi:hypothetical protein
MKDAFIDQVKEIQEKLENDIMIKITKFENGLLVDYLFYTKEQLLNRIEIWKNQFEESIKTENLDVKNCSFQRYCEELNKLISKYNDAYLKCSKKNIIEVNLVIAKEENLINQI